MQSDPHVMQHLRRLDAEVAALRRDVRAVLELLAQRWPQPDDALLAAVLGRLAARGLPVQFTLPELLAEGVITASESHRLRYVLRDLVHLYGGVFSGLRLVHVGKVRNVVLYNLQRM